MSASAGERLSRLLALVPWLLAHDGVTIDECAEHFGVSAEQLEKDLWLLVVCGVPGYGPDQLVDIDFWDDGIIHVLDPQTLGRPLRLTHEEALTVLVALRMLAQLPGLGDRGAVLTAAAKIERQSSESGSARFVAVRVDVPGEVTAVVDAALAQDRELEITYAAATRDEVTERTVRPVRVLVVDGIGYLEAFCRSAGALRTFRLDRILTASLGEAAAPDLPDLRDLPGTPVRSETQRAAVLALAPAARWLADVHGGTSVLGEDAQGRTLVRLPLHSVDWAVRLVLAHGGDVVALEPAELVDAVADAARAALASYPEHVR